MRSSLSTTSIFDLDNPKKYLSLISDIGMHSMMLDLGVFCTKYHLENFGKKEAKIDTKKLYEQFELLVEQSRNLSICYDSVRLPHLLWNTRRTDLNDLMLQVGEKGISVCKKIDCHYMIAQPLFSGIMKQNRWQENYRYYFRLGRIAKENNICILMENQCDSVNGHLVRGICSDALTTLKLMDSLNEELGEEVFGFCLDTVACNLCGQDMGEIVVELGKNLKAVLIRECDGIREMSKLPGIGGGSVKWLSLIRGLRKIEFDGLMIMDASDTLQEFSHLLRPQVYLMINAVADFFKWQIEMEQQLKKYPIRVLFGAGKMCQNYLEYYGRLYPPMFVCDNNPKLWGKKVSGLDIKSPEVLHNLPQDCGVIICNVFYKEIAEQLRNMGIKNIGTFNDEYLPEFVDFDGFERRNKGGCLQRSE